MIQHNRQSPAQRQNGLDVWGKWANRKHYSLEVVQHPLRARMCGFGDKDRRPLAPAAVAKMIVKREDDSLVDVDDVDCSFFLVTVDLWSADGKQEVNLVLHPSSANHYAPPHPAPKAIRKVSSQQAVGSRSGESQSARPPSPSLHRANESSGTPSTPIPPFGGQPYYGTQGNPPGGAAPYHQPGPYGPPAPSNAPAPWNYSQAPPADRSTGFPPPILPSISSFATQSSPRSSESWQPWNAPEDSNPQGPHGNQSGDQDDQGSFQTPAPPATYAHYPQPIPGDSTSVVTLPRHAYTRTLVGPLSANACLLSDEHRKPGIFFLFQDLSVRTEGTFRLRMRLMNVGAPPAPDAGATRILTDISPVLAQTFTEPFTVYSAKRFPGVPDTTALSIAFGNQGQKLPLRNRHGSSKRRRRGGDSDDDVSDDG